MRVGFAGTPAFAATALAAILDAGFAVPLVLTQPDRPAGRGMKLQGSAVKALAVARGLRVLQPATLKAGEARDAAFATPIDVLVVAAYGLILPAQVLAWPRLGCLNIHASLLPRWRGAAPIERALLAGDEETGVTIMKMDEGLDTGPVVGAVRVPISPRETAGSLRDRLAAAGALAIIDTLTRLLRDGTLESTPQTESGATYAAKIRPGDALIDWNAPAQAIDRQVRSLDPGPGATTTFAGLPVKLWSVEPLPAVEGAAGVVIEAGAPGIVVGCGRGAVRIRNLQPAGGRRMDAAAFLSGRTIGPGARFGDEDGAPVRNR